MGHDYVLYALEKACIFADLEEVGKARERRSWYSEGARWFLERQRQDGGWAAVYEREHWPSYGRHEKHLMEEGNTIDTAFALLFLVRSPATLHPTTPSEVDAPASARDRNRPVTTPDGAGK